MARYRDVYTEGGEYQRSIPIADERKFIFQWFEIDSTEEFFEGTWKEVQDFICENEYLRHSASSCLSNSRDEVIFFCLDINLAQ